MRIRIQEGKIHHEKSLRFLGRPFWRPGDKKIAIFDKKKIYINFQL
jgi:hypothetical protein